MKGRATVSPHLRARHRLRTYLCERPAVYLPIARRRYPGPSPQVIGPTTELVIDGYTRCASTFVVYAFQLAQARPVRVAHHLHAPAQLITSVRRQLPTLAVIREPRGAVLSQLVREPDVDLRDALVAYARFYEKLMPYHDGLVVGEFRELTGGDLAAVVRRLNGQFGTSYAEPQPCEETARECTELIEARPSHSPVLLGFESGLVTRDELRAARTGDGASVSYGGTPPAVRGLWVPSPGRDRAKAALQDAWEQADRALRGRAERAYGEFTSTGTS